MDAFSAGKRGRDSYVFFLSTCLIWHIFQCFKICMSIGSCLVFSFFFLGCSLIISFLRGFDLFLDS